MPVPVTPNPSITHAEVAFLETAKGQRITVDIADLPAVQRCRWCVGAKGQVATHIKRRTVYLGRLLMGAPPGHRVVHLNGNKLDLRRDNLLVVRWKQKEAQ